MTGTPCVSRYSSVRRRSRIDFAPAQITATGVRASTACRNAVAALAAGRPKVRLSAAARKRMAQRLILADELSTMAAALAGAARKKRGRG